MPIYSHHGIAMIADAMYCAKTNVVDFFQTITDSLNIK